MVHKQTHKKTAYAEIETDQRSRGTQLKDKDMEFHRDSGIVYRLVFPLFRESIMPAKKYESLRQVRAAIVGVQLALEEVERAEERVDNAQDHLDVIRRVNERGSVLPVSGIKANPENEVACKLHEAQQEKTKRDDEWKKTLTKVKQEHDNLVKVKDHAFRAGPHSKA